MAHTAKGWDFDRITPEQLRTAMDDLGLDINQFAFRTMTRNPRTVQRWLNGEQDIPAWMPVMCALLGRSGGADLAERVAQALVIREGL